MTSTLFATEAELHLGEAAAEMVREGLAEFQVDAINALSGEVMVARGSTELVNSIHPRA